MSNCKHLRIETDEQGLHLYKCNISNDISNFFLIKEAYESIYKNKAILNGECMFMRHSTDLTKCPFYQE